MVKSIEHTSKNSNSQLHHFTPAFALPQHRGSNSAVYSHPESMHSYQDVNPIQLVAHIPVTRLIDGLSTQEQEAFANESINIRFRVKGHRITTEIITPSLTGIPKDLVQPLEERISKQSWYDLMKESERVDVMRYIMAEFRHRALGNEGFRVAAIGITHDHELFIASNTRPHHQLYKKCAETAVIAAAIEHSEKANKDHDYQQQLFDTPKPNVMFEDFFVMGGKDNSSVNIACPCGSCTDELYDHMAVKTEAGHSGNIYILPAENGHGHEHNGALTKLTPNHSARNLHGLEDGEYWKVTPEKLYGVHSYKTRGPLKAMQKQALREVLNEETALSSPLDELHDKVSDFLKSVTKEKAGKPSHSVDCATLAGTIAIRNAMRTADEQTQRKIWDAHCEQLLTNTPTLALEASAAKNEGGQGKPGLETLNRFMSHEINQVIASRLAEYRTKEGKNLNTKNVDQYIGSIRCVVLQLADGQFVHGIEANTELDSSMPNAELSAVTKNLDQISKHDNPVVNVWEMAFNPAAIKKGKIPTLTRDGAERIGKRAQDLKNLKIKFIPYNDGSLNKEVLEEYTRATKFSGIYPGMFAGRHGNGTRPSIANMPAPETDNGASR